MQVRILSHNLTIITSIHRLVAGKIKKIYKGGNRDDYIFLERIFDEGKGFKFQSASGYGISYGL